MEVWRDILGFEGFYQVSDIGNVRSLDRFSKSNREFKGVLLSPFLNAYGYCCVNLVNGNVRKSKRINILVAEAFIPNPLNKKQVNHNDEVKTNNKKSNLSWMTAKENSNHGSRTKRIVKKLSVPVYQYDSDLNLIKKWVSLNSTKEGGFSPSAVCKCCSGSRKHHKNFIFSYKYLNSL